MVDQTVMNGTNRSHGRPAGVIEGVGSFGADVASLAVLQARLAKCDFREGMRQLTPLLVTLTVLAVLAIAGIVTLVLGVADWVSAVFEFSPGVARILVGIACVIIGGAVGFFCIRALTKGPSIFQRSFEEFERNLAWVKTTLTQSGR
jgi:formate hydrogenlyase subunit 3/multisubunit Na+/H+ antiporter MnhD subunit